MTICTRHFENLNAMRKITLLLKVLLSQIVTLRAKCLHLVCGVPEWLAVNYYSSAFCALHTRQIHFVKNPGLMP